MRPRALLLAAAALLAVPAGAAAEAEPKPLGLAISADLGGGGAISGDGVFEAEAVVGYHLAWGLSLELGLVLGLAPGTYFAVRPGLHYAIAETPFYARLAVDAGSPGGTMHWRWLLLGFGAELRFTRLFGGYAEFDGGVPLTEGAGVPMLLRLGFFLTF